MSQRRLLASLQAPFLKDKKGVRFSALYLQKKRNLLVLDHSHQQVSYFSMLVQSLSGSTYISWYSNSLDQKWQSHMQFLKGRIESKKTSKRQPGTGGSNEGTRNIPGVPDESTVVSGASSEGIGSKPGVPNEEKLILEWEADVDSEHS
ncbi:hypothetical protein Tco_0497657 [Tanacetum coccineum]